MALLEYSLDAWARADEARGATQHVSVSAPQMVCTWTRAAASEGGGYLYNESAGLRTLLPDPNVLIGTDLSDGYPNSYIRKEDPDDAVSVDVIVYAAVFSGLDLSRPTVITFRNNLNKLLLTPVQPNDPWVIDAVSHGHTLFLDIVKVPEHRQQQQYGSAADQDRFTYYGYKFEALCTGAEPSKPVDCTGEFAIMVQVRLGHHLVLMAAEVDAWDPLPEGRKESPDEDYTGFVELKTFVVPQGDRAVERLYREKYPRWWVQSYLAGVPTMVLGGRDRSGILRQIQRLPVIRLPALAQEAGYPFDAFRILRFGDAALKWMSRVAAERPGEHCRFEYVPNHRTIRASVVEGGSLPERVMVALAGGVQEQEQLQEGSAGDGYEEKEGGEELEQL